MSETPTPSISLGTRIGQIIGFFSLMLLHLFIFFIGTAAIVTVVPKFREYFERIDLPLAPATELAIVVNNSFVNYSYLYLLVGMGLDFGILAVLTFGFRRATWLRSAYSHLWITGWFLLLFFMLLALGIPFPDEVSIEVES